MEETSNYKLRIWLTGSRIPIVPFLSADEICRFDTEHKSWMENGQSKDQFECIEYDKLTSIRFKNISMWECPANIVTTPKPVQDGQQSV